MFYEFKYDLGDQSTHRQIIYVSVASFGVNRRVLRVFAMETRAMELFSWNLIALSSVIHPVVITISYENGKKLARFEWEPFVFPFGIMCKYHITFVRLLKLSSLTSFVSLVFSLYLLISQCYSPQTLDKHFIKNFTVANYDAQSKHLHYWVYRW